MCCASQNRGMEAGSFQVANKEVIWGAGGSLSGSVGREKPWMAALLRDQEKGTKKADAA